MIIQGLVHVPDNASVCPPDELAVATIDPIHHLLDVGPSAVRALAIAYATLQEPTAMDPRPVAFVQVRDARVELDRVLDVHLDQPPKGPATWTWTP